MQEHCQVCRAPKRHQLLSQELASELSERGVAVTREELLKRIWIDPARCGGKPCIRGHRIWVSLVLDLLASGSSVDEILADYPGLTPEDIQACIAYGSEMARERYVDVPLETHA